MTTTDTASLPRIEADEKMAADAGLTFKDSTLFAHGTVLYDSGIAAAKRSRAVAVEARQAYADHAHEGTWKSAWAQEELEAQGSALLYNYVVLGGRELEVD